MNNIGKLIKAKTISFNETLIKNYCLLNLNETEAMILMVLYNQQNEGNSYLSIKSLKERVTITEENLSNYVMLLVQKGMIEILIDEDGKETFNLDQVMDKLGELLDNHKTAEYDKTFVVNEIVSFTEKVFLKPLTSSDLIIINEWINNNYDLEEIKRAILQTTKVQKQSLKYADAVLVSNHNTKRTQTEADPKIKEIIDSIYAKRR